MAFTNQERVANALELLKVGLAPFVEREIHAAVKAGAVNMETVRRFSDDPMLARKPLAQWDAAGLLKLMWETWNEVFRKTLGSAERSLVVKFAAIGTIGRTSTPFRATTPTERSTRSSAY